MRGLLQYGGLDVGGGGVPIPRVDFKKMLCHLSFSLDLNSVEFKKWSWCMLF